MGLRVNDTIEIPDSVLELRFSRSGGPGGQNVNKVSSRVELSVRLEDLPISIAARRRLRLAAGRRVSTEGVLTLSAQGSRDQSSNRATCLERLVEMVRAALVAPRPRVPTRPGRAARERRLTTKRKTSEKKKLRRGAP